MEDKKMLEQKHIISTEIILQALGQAENEEDSQDFIDGLMNELERAEHLENMKGGYSTQDENGME